MRRRRTVAGLLATAVLLPMAATGCAADDDQLRTPDGKVISTTVTAVGKVDLVNPGRDYSAACQPAAPADPGAPATERVLLTDPALLDAVCALGLSASIRAVTAQSGAVPAYLGPQIGAIPLIGTAPDADTVADAAPQLVLTTPDTADELAAIRSTGALGNARVVTVAGADWQTRFTATAAALHRSQAGAERLTNLTTDAAKVGRRLDARHTQVSLVRFTDDATLIEGTANLPTQVLTMIGASRPVAQRHDAPVSALGGDYTGAEGDIIYVSFVGDGGERHGNEVLRSNTWLDLGAATWRRVRAVDDQLWFSGDGLTAAWLILGDLRTTLNSASSS